MRRKSSFLAILLAALCCATATAALGAAPSQASLDRIPSAMQGFVDRHEVAGVVTVVGRHDGIIACHAVGFRDLESREPMTKDSLFLICSMTKPLTGTAVMLLADEGKLAIDDPVEKHLGEFRGQMLVAGRSAGGVTLKRPARKITIRDLLTHTSGQGGMPEGLADLYRKRDRTLSEAVMAFSQRPLEFEPGSKWAYSSVGTDVLGRIVEVVGRMPYEEFMKKRIFEPLGMRDTMFYPDDRQCRRVAVLYEVKPGQLVRSANPPIGSGHHARYPLPAGGVYSTGADLARFYQMALNGGRYQGRQLVSEKSLRAMTSVQSGQFEVGFVPGMAYGLGWGVVRQPQGVTRMLSPGTFGHGGAYGTQGWVDPKQDLFVILLIQRTGVRNGDASEIRGRFQELAVAAIKGG
jgi:CubicO group peptidase (beta-lactamase class C family)